MVRARNRFLKKTNLDLGLSQVDREKLLKAKASDVCATTGLSYAAAVHIKYGGKLQETFNMAGHKFTEDRIWLALKRVDLPLCHQQSLEEVLEFCFTL